MHTVYSTCRLNSSPPHLFFRNNWNRLENWNCSNKISELPDITHCSVVTKDDSFALLDKSCGHCCMKAVSSTVLSQSQLTVEKAEKCNFFLYCC